MADIDKVKIVNWALVELGLAPKFSIDDQTSLGGFVDMFWPRALARSFGLHDWTFCRRTSLLTRRAGTPNNGWTHGFDLPGDILGPPLKLTFDAACEMPLRDFTIEGTVVFANSETVYARCKVQLAPEAWPQQFADAFATLLASYLAIPLTQDTDLKAEKLADAIGTRSEGGAGGMFGRMIAQDRAAAPVGSPAVTDVLSGGRSGSYYPWSGRW